MHIARRMHDSDSSTNDLSSPLIPSQGTVRAFVCKRYGSAYRLLHLSALECLTSLACPQPTLPSADFSYEVNIDCSMSSQFLSHARSQGTRQISRGKTQNVPRVDAGFIKHAPRENGGLRSYVPARPERATPQIRFVYLAPRFWIGLPSDPTSRWRPCPSPSLRLRLNLASGLSPD